MLQLYEQIQTRFGIVLIGASGSGKTIIWKTLRKAIELMDAPEQDNQAKQTSIKVNTILISPKSLVPRSRLFGYIDEDTREWQDGLFSIKSRELLRSTNEEMTGSAIVSSM